MKIQSILFAVLLSLLPAAVKAQSTSSVPFMPQISSVTDDMIQTQEEGTVFKRKFGFGGQFTYNWVPEFWLHIAVKGAHDVSDSSFGGRFIYRTKNADVTFKLMYWKINQPSGIWLGINHDWADAEWTEFDNLQFLYGEIAVTWNTKLVSLFNGRSNLFFIYGFGIGGGTVMGDVYTTPAYGCTADNYKDPQPTGSPSACTYTPASSEREKEDIPRAMGALEAFIGLRLDLMDMLSLKGELGIFLPGFLQASLAVEFYF
ncbi:hypothetical protein KKF34_06465 [Myxococcota bacterium]|nr:hypothetical protein [Myxococcota bacterium]MBU1382936.1 hypothetical protein [Myxococcota bacterium]MBU1496503.1 hypothetical protein [Myxococcota bacterium]